MTNLDWQISICQIQTQAQSQCPNHLSHEIGQDGRIFLSVDDSDRQGLFLQYMSMTVYDAVLYECAVYLWPLDDRIKIIIYSAIPYLFLGRLEASSAHLTEPIVYVLVSFWALCTASVFFHLYESLEEASVLEKIKNRPI